MPRPDAVVRQGPRTFVLLGTVRGLKAEGVRVDEAFDAAKPAGVALGVAPEDLDGLASYREGSGYEHFYSEADEVYAHFLRQFGEVELPPTELLRGVRLAREAGLPVVAIDLPEREYIEAFMSRVGGWALIRYSFRVRRLARKEPPAEDARGFHLWWDLQLRKLPGFDRLERAREEGMARRLLAADLPREGAVLVVVEAARLAGLVAELQRQQPDLSAEVEPWASEFGKSRR